MNLCNQRPGGVQNASSLNRTLWAPRYTFLSFPLSICLRATVRWNVEEMITAILAFPSLDYSTAILIHAVLSDIDVYGMVIPFDLAPGHGLRHIHTRCDLGILYTYFYVTKKSQVFRNRWRGEQRTISINKQTAPKEIQVLQNSRTMPFALAQFGWRQLFSTPPANCTCEYEQGQFRCFAALVTICSEALILLLSEC